MIQYAFLITLCSIFSACAMQTELEPMSLHKALELGNVPLSYRLFLRNGCSHEKNDDGLTPLMVYIKSMNTVLEFANAKQGNVCYKNFGNPYLSAQDVAYLARVVYELEFIQLLHFLIATGAQVDEPVWDLVESLSQRNEIRLELFKALPITADNKTVRPY